MPATLSTHHEQLATALRQARLGRHQPDCRCFRFRSSQRAAYCSPAEWRWSNMIDRLLTTVLNETQPKDTAP